MKVQLRFRDLQERGVVDSWPQLKRLQEKYGFPLGRMLAPNTRCWDEAEVDVWIASRPVENPRRQGAATPEGAARAQVTKAAKRASLKTQNSEQSAGPEGPTLSCSPGSGRSRD